MQDNFFKDLVVIELASVLAGPAVGLFFAELGAKVIKIENSTTNGDVTRKWRLAHEDKDRNYSAYYCSVNWGKEIHFKDLSDPIDQEFIYDLVRKADIVISNSKASSAEKLGMDYPSLKAINPKIIYGLLTGYKHSQKPAFDAILQAETGFLSMTGEKDGGPVKMPVALLDVIAAHQLKEAILIALLHRYKTGKGSFIQSSLEESSIASLVNQASNFLMEGHIAQKMGVEHPNIVPYGTIFTTQDGVELVIGVGTEKHFASLCQCLQLPDLVTHEHFRTNKDRVANRQEVIETLNQQFQKFKFSYIYDCLLNAQVPAAKLNTIQDVFEGETGKAMILEQKMEDGTIARCVQSIAFQIQD